VSGYTGYCGKWLTGCDGTFGICCIWNLLKVVNANKFVIFVSGSSTTLSSLDFLDLRVSESD
jgi:hypothetical protein